MPSIEWLKINKGKPQEIPPKSSNSLIISDLFYSRMHDICLLVDARISQMKIDMTYHKLRCIEVMITEISMLKEYRY